MVGEGTINSRCRRGSREGTIRIESDRAAAIRIQGGRQLVVVGIGVVSQHARPLNLQGRRDSTGVTIRIRGRHRCKRRGQVYIDGTRDSRAPVYIVGETASASSSVRRRLNVRERAVGVQSERAATESYCVVRGVACKRDAIHVSAFSDHTLARIGDVKRYARCAKVSGSTSRRHSCRWDSARKPSASSADTDDEISLHTTIALVVRGDAQGAVEHRIRGTGKGCADNRWLHKNIEDLAGGQKYFALYLGTRWDSRIFGNPQGHIGLNVAVFRDQRKIQPNRGWNVHPRTGVHKAQQDVTASSGSYRARNGNGGCRRGVLAECHAVHEIVKRGV